MSDSLKDVPNGEMVPDQSELQLADFRIKELERQLEAARDEIARLKQELGSSAPSSPSQ